MHDVVFPCPAPDYVINGYGYPMQTVSYGHWCTFTDLYHAMPRCVM